jgi:hypothetical protein
MPPKSRNLQLAAARKSKQLKKTQTIEESLFENDDLSDNFEEDGIWNDDDLEETVDKITPSVFDIMCQNSKDPVIFNNARPLTYHGNSDRTKRRKKAAAKEASKGSANISKYFINNSAPVSLLNDQINIIADDLINLEEIIEREGFNLALEELNELIKDKSLISQVKNRLQLILQYINLRLAGHRCMEASQTIAVSIGKGKYQARLIRTWTQNFVIYRSIPTSMRGKHQKIKSLLGDEDIYQMITEYLRSVGCDVTVEKFKEYIEQEVFPSVGIENKKSISNTTVRAWLKHFGWTFRIGAKDIYYDGHERSDVLEYRQEFLAEMEQLEQWMPKPSDDDIMTLIEPNLNEGDKRHILVTHDESVFYANDGKKTFWGPIGHQPLRKKGTGLSLHVSDFLTEVDGRLKFEQDEACVTMKPGVNRDGWWKTEDLIAQVIFYFYYFNYLINLF